MNKKELCWNITSKCNQNCVYCFRDQTSCDCLLEENVKILQYLISRGVSELTWSGGEPLLYTGLESLLRMAFEYNIVNKINTNASLLSTDRLKQVAEYIDTFTLSLDSFNPKINSILGRGQEHHNHVCTVVNQIKRNYPTKKVTINMVVNRVNLCVIDTLIDNLNKLPIDGVRVFQVAPIRGRSKETFDSLSITQEQFEQVKTFCLTHLIHTNVTFRDKASLEKEYLIITPNGNLCYNSNGQDILIKQLRGIIR